jgi:hypothetical protein
MRTAVVMGTDVGRGRAFVEVLSSGAAEESPAVTELGLDLTDPRVVTIRIARLVLDALDETPQVFQNDGSARPW